MDFFSDTESLGVMECFPPWRFFFPSHLAATELFFFIYGFKTKTNKKTTALNSWQDARESQKGVRSSV